MGTLHHFLPARRKANLIGLDQLESFTAALRDLRENFRYGNDFTFIKTSLPLPSPQWFSDWARLGDFRIMNVTHPLWKGKR